MRGNKLAGSVMGVTVDGIFINCETDGSMQFEAEMLPTSSVLSGRWRSFRPGKKSWTITVNGHLLKREAGQDFKTLYDAFFDDREVIVQFRTRPSVDQFLIFEGKAFISMGNASAPNKGSSTWSMTFQGTGILNKNWEEFWAIINSMPASSDQPTYIDTTDWS